MSHTVPAMPGVASDTVWDLVGLDCILESRERIRQQRHVLRAKVVDFRIHRGLDSDISWSSRC